MKGIVMTSDPERSPELATELQESYSITELVTLGPGVVFAEAVREKEYDELKFLPPFFLRHMFPVDSINDVKSGNDVFAAASSFARNKSSDLKGPVAVQCRVYDRDDVKPRDVKEAVDGVLVSLGCLPTVKDPELILSFVATGDALYCGLSTPQDNLNSWSGGAVHYRHGKDVLSRSSHKLEEAVEVFGIDLNDHIKALDLGAAPGGWTSFLLAQGLRVTAVDTGKLHSSLLGHPDLTFLQKNAFELTLRYNSFDLITCDMSWDPMRTASIINMHARSLVDDGKLIMTVKFMGDAPLRTIRRCIDVLKQNFNLLQGRHLWHNRDEVTLYLERRE